MPSTPSLTSSPTDADLILRAQSGDRHAEEALLDRHERLLWSVIKRWVSSTQDAFEAEDLLQEARLGLLAAIRRYQPDRGAVFGTYAYRCIAHAVLKAVRLQGGSLIRTPTSKRAAAPALLSLEALTEDGVPLADLVPANDDVEAEVVSAATVAEVLSLVPVPDRPIMRMAVVQEMTGPEIATALGITRRQVERQRGRALALIREAIGAG